MTTGIMAWVVSPLMRMALLSSVLADESIELTTEEYNMFLTGSLSDIDAFMTDKYGKNTSLTSIVTLMAGITTMILVQTKTKVTV